MERSIKVTPFSRRPRERGDPVAFVARHWMAVPRNFGLRPRLAAPRNFGLRPRLAAPRNFGLRPRFPACAGMTNSWLLRSTVAAAIVFLALPSSAADMTKTIRTAFIVAETGFDPQATTDLYSDSIQRAIFDTLYGFDYLTRPYKRVPRTAAAMPEITDGGRTWTIKVKPGIYFTDDPAFKGKKRELTAADYVYSWKRLIDPRVRSPFSWYVQDKIVGAEAVIEAAKNTDRVDCDAPIEGLQALDRYTLRLKFTEPDYIMLGYMTQS